MPTQRLSLDELDRLHGGRSGSAPEPGAVVVVDLDAAGARPSPTIPDALPVVVVGTATAVDPHLHPWRDACDVVLAAGDPSVDAVVHAVAERPLAATSLAMLLRSSERRDLEAGLLAESATYSLLQAGPELASWLSGRVPRARTDDGPPLVVERVGSRLTLTLDRPHVRNALDRALRDALLEALAVPAVDPSITEVVLRGNGASFCSGGDLDEFGTYPDPATAHLVRVVASVGRAVSEVADRTSVHLHGACLGSGIELPAFAGRVVADPGTTLGLPEVALGLVPGAGGTWSLPRRIGRWRTARLALTGERVDAPTALAWGLVDAIEPIGA